MTPERRFVTEHWITTFEHAAEDQWQYMQTHPEEMEDKSRRLLLQAQLDSLLSMAETLYGQLAEHAILEKETKGGLEQRINPWQRHPPRKESLNS